MLPLLESESLISTCLSVLCEWQKNQRCTFEPFRVNYGVNILKYTAYYMYWGHYNLGMSLPKGMSSLPAPFLILIILPAPFLSFFFLLPSKFCHFPAPWSHMGFNLPPFLFFPILPAPWLPLNWGGSDIYIACTEKGMLNCCSIPNINSETTCVWNTAKTPYYYRYQATQYE